MPKKTGTIGLGVFGLPTTISNEGGGFTGDTGGGGGGPWDTTGEMATKVVVAGGKTFDSTCFFDGFVYTADNSTNLIYKTDISDDTTTTITMTSIGLSTAIEPYNIYASEGHLVFGNSNSTNTVFYIHEIGTSTSVTVTTSVSGTDGYSIEGGEVFFVDTGRSNLKKVPFAGGVPTSVATLGGTSGPNWLDTSDYYYYRDNPVSQFERYTRSGGAKSSLSAGGTINYIHTFGDNVVYFSSGSPGNNYFVGTEFATLINLTGITVTQGNMGFDGTNLYWVDGDGYSYIKVVV